MQPLMLLDTASLYFRAFYGVSESVRSPDGQPVNAVRGLLDMMTKLIARFEPEQLVACWDESWRPAWRVGLLPSYKAHRVIATGPDGESIEEMPDSLRRQLPHIRELLEGLNIPICGRHGFEADDVIGTLAREANGPVRIVTGDRDLFQLVDDSAHCEVIYTARGMSNLEVVTNAVVQERYGISASQYVDFAVLRGDPSDGLPGVRGIGDKTAARLLETFGSLRAIREAAAESSGMSAKQAESIVDASSYLDVAETVVRVATVPDLPVPATGWPQLHDASRAKRFATELGYERSLARYLSATAEASAGEATHSK